MKNSWRPFLILHGRPDVVNKVLVCLIVFLDIETRALTNKSSRPIYLNYKGIYDNFNDLMAAIFNFK